MTLAELGESSRERKGKRERERERATRSIVIFFLRERYNYYEIKYASTCDSSWTNNVQRKMSILEKYTVDSRFGESFKSTCKRIQKQTCRFNCACCLVTFYFRQNDSLMDSFKIGISLFKEHREHRTHICKNKKSKKHAREEGIKETSAFLYKTN